MFTISLKRILQGALVIVCVTFISFMLLRIIPGDPARTMAPNATEEQLQEIRNQMGVNETKLVQFQKYISDLFDGNLGYSYFNNDSVSHLIIKSIPKTMLLVINSLVFSLAAGILLGVIAAMNSKSALDDIISGFAILMQSTPNYFLATILIMIFGVKLKMFPVMGYKGYSSTILPSLMIALPITAAVIKNIRSSLMEGYGQDFIKAAHARGIHSYRVLTRYGLRSALISLLNLIGNQMAVLVGGIFVAEWIFSYPGLGLETLNALFRRDYLMTQGAILVISSFFIIVTMIIDLSYTYLDPRLRKS